MPTGNTLTIPARPKTSFAGDVLKLVSGTTLAQLLTILAAPLLTRLYTPDAFGLLAIFIAISGILGTIACMRYELAIMLPERDEEAANLLAGSLCFVLISSLLTLALVSFGGTKVANLLKAPQLAEYLWLLPLSIFVSGVFLALNYWNSRTRHFGRLSIARVSAAVSTTSGQLGAGYIGPATGGTLIAAGVAGQAVATTVLAGQIWRDDHQLFAKSIRCSRISSSLAEHRKFPLFSTFSSFLNTLSAQLPVLVLTTYFTQTVVGHYALGLRVIQIPGSLIGSAIAQVFYQRASLARTHGTLPQLVQETFSRLVIIGTFPILALMITGSDIFSFIFGIQWKNAGLYAQILSPWIIFLFLQSPISSLFSVLGKQEVLFAFDIFTVIARFLSLVIGGILQSSIISLTLFSATGVIINIMLLIYLFNALNISPYSILSTYLCNSTSAILFLSPIIIIQFFDISQICICMLLLSTSICYYLYICFYNKQIRSLFNKSSKNTNLLQ